MQTPKHRLTTEKIRLIIDGPKPGGRNMAIDETLLSGLTSPGSVPTVRLYSFSPATISVGRFQRAADTIDFDAIERDGLNFVRRPSAGQAVLHQNELTYCVVLGRNHLDSFGKREVYRFIVPLLLEGLARAGVKDSQSVSSVRGERTDPDCFATTSEYEIDSRDERKLIGSAQMITRTGVLQHGSVPLAPAEKQVHDYFLDSQPDTQVERTYVSEQADESVTLEQATEAFVSAFESILPIERGELTPDEMRSSDALQTTKYDQAAWNRKY